MESSSVQSLHLTTSLSESFWDPYRLFCRSEVCSFYCWVVFHQADPLSLLICSQLSETECFHIGMVVAFPGVETPSLDNSFLPLSCQLSKPTHPFDCVSWQRIWEDGFLRYLIFSEKSLYVFFYLIFFQLFFIYLVLVALGLCCCSQAFSSCGEQGGYPLIVVCWLLIAVASPVVEYRL